MNARAVSLLAFLPLLPTPSTEPRPEPEPVFHCQIPCGIYGDKMRIDMLMEDAATIEKGMAQIKALEDLGEVGNRNQMVRWVMNKDTHAQSIQDQVAGYWLAQRIKAPTDDSAEAKERYHHQLELMHAITVKAMKCKQTTDPANVADLRALALAFAETYFTKEDLEHIKGHKDEH